VAKAKAKVKVKSLPQQASAKEALTTINAITYSL